jgi:hypothetical protein
MAALFSPTPTGVAAGQAAVQAVRFSERLSQRDRDRLAVIDRFLAGDADEGERYVRAILRSYPEDMEAWYYLGEFLFHYGARTGRPIAEASAAFERALEYDPDHFTTLIHLCWIRAIEQRYADLERLAEHMAELERGSEYPQYSRPLRAFLRGGQPAVRGLLPELRSESATSLMFGGVFQLSVLDDGLGAAAEIAGLLTDPSRPTSERSSGYAVQSSLEMAQGHLRAADEAMERLEALDLPAEFETPLEKRAVVWTSPAVPTESADLEELQVRLADLDYDTVYAPVTRPYLLGLVAARLGRPAEALRHASRLESRAARQGGVGSSRAATLAEYFATILRAQVAYGEGDPDGAFRLLDQAQADDWWALRPAYLLLSQANERFLRAQTLEALGRDEEALVWYASFGWVSQADGPFVAPALLRTAEIYERLGDAEQAAANYRRYITRWADCDPELRPLVTGAEQALARLTAATEAP